MNSLRRAAAAQRGGCAGGAGRRKRTHRYSRSALSTSRCCVPPTLLDAAPTAARLRIDMALVIMLCTFLAGFTAGLSAYGAAFRGGAAPSFADDDGGVPPGTAP